MNESDTSLEFAGRLGLIEALLSDVLLNLLANSNDPILQCQRVRDETIHKLRFRSVLPPDATASDADIGLAVQTKVIEFAGRFFADIEAGLSKKL